MSKPVKPLEFHGFVIVNPHGSIWSTRIFDTAEGAMSYLRGWWKEVPNVVFDEAKWSIVRGKSLLTPTESN